MIKIILGLFILIVPFVSSSATLDVRLVISSGQISLSGGANVPGKTYSTNTSFQQSSDILIWTQNDDVNLRVVNFDTEDHGFVVEGYANYGSIPAGDSVEQNILLSNTGIFRYYDPLNSPYNEYLGLNGIIHIKAATDNSPYFYWDIHEFQSAWNTSILGGGTPLLSDYNPEYFTINGNSSPDINTDPTARVIGSVGNEFKVVLVNNGLSIHSLHFHGYHLVIEHDSNNPISVGREKDTFPIYPKESLILSCTPDKEGEYPVHDHNLVAVTGGGIYANGMFSTLLISP